jgi:hypothetical protein
VTVLEQHAQPPATLESKLGETAGEPRRACLQTVVVTAHFVIHERLGISATLGGAEQRQGEVHERSRATSSMASTIGL